MSNRPAFLKSRIEHYLKSGVPIRAATEEANEDFVAMTRLCNDVVMTLEDDELPGKGVTRCNRTACQSDKHVVFHNSVMNKMYCVACATDIRFCNDLNDLDLYPEYNESLDKLLKENAK